MFINHILMFIAFSHISCIYITYIDTPIPIISHVNYHIHNYCARTYALTLSYNLHTHTNYYPYPLSFLYCSYIHIIIFLFLHSLYLIIQLSSIIIFAYINLLHAAHIVPLTSYPQ